LNAPPPDHRIARRLLFGIPLGILLWRLVGVLSTSVGLVNAFVPILPTTIFLIIGVWAFGKGAPHWRERLLQHRRFGKPLRDWEDGGRVSRRGKVLAVIGISASWMISAYFIGLGWVIASLGIVLASLAVWLATRPLPRE
jgi:uncharacterized membrane protein YbaN (DUF454 family)